MTHWNPTHAARCIIRGWQPLAFSSKYDFAQKFTQLKIFYKPKLFDYGIQGGGTDLRTVTLDQFYKWHLLGQNTWSRSNEGFDLARYFGTAVTLYPHPHVPYFYFYQSNWETTEDEQFPYMHPAWLMTHTKNRVLILPRSWGNRRRKRIWIKPPALQTSTWYFQSSWVGVPLFRHGITPVNLQDPFVHAPPPGYPAQYAVSIGWAQSSQQMPPLPLSWSYQSLQAGFDVEVMYRWWWDDGIDNFMLVNENNTPPSLNNRLKVVPINMPYYQFFYGWKYPTSTWKTPMPQNTNPTYKPGENPSPVAILWYRDVGITVQLPEGSGIFMNPYITRPQDLDIKTKVWVILSSARPSTYTSDTLLQRNFTEQPVGVILHNMVGRSPFVMSGNDIPFEHKGMNFLMKYRSFWQWGGVAPRPDNILNPADVHQQYRPVQVRDPATVGNAALHPWDLTQGGGIDPDKFRALLADALHLKHLHGHPTTSHPEEAPQTSRGEDEGPWRFGDPESGDESTDTESESETSEDETPKATRRVLRRLRRHLRLGRDVSHELE